MCFRDDVHFVVENLRECREKKKKRDEGKKVEEGNIVRTRSNNVNKMMSNKSDGE